MRKPLNVFESLIALKPLKPLTVEALESVDAFWKFCPQAVGTWRVELLNPRTLRGLRDA